MDEEKTVIFIITCIALIIIFSFTNLILLYIEEKKEQYGDGYFKDIYQNLQLTPIKSIKIETDVINCHNLFLDADKIYKWKDICFQIQRIDSNYLKLLNKENNSFQIGTDSLGNKLNKFRKYN